MFKDSNILNRSVKRRGIYLALGAALISGFSVYMNKFAVQEIGDPYLLTTTKNIAVAVMLFSLFMLPKSLPEMKTLSRKQWLTLMMIGFLGGSIPFLLFFKGLSVGTSAGAAFIHKTLFIWVTILAVIFLRERIGKLHIIALSVLIGGNLLLLGWPENWMGNGELYILAATFFWALEAIFARKIMQNISSNVAAFARMFFGAIIMIIYLGMVGKLNTIAVLDAGQIGWIVLTSIFLLGYVICYYGGLKHASASVVTSILVLGSVVTSFLYAIFDSKRYTVEEITGLVLIATSVAFLWCIAFVKQKSNEVDIVSAKL